MTRDAAQRVETLPPGGAGPRGEELRCQRQSGASRQTETSPRHVHPPPTAPSLANATSCCSTAARLR
ncbi:hypothetical protein EYF80_066177 [Liparis tanakae]|uniref:Uncharacterized protein n=1 Tax=Liparis tanakae TaxID=230148 RepID=A0A4Z2E4N6_9TELE|nr:hypothetical protein EYF80_066177 [Liparis tanakae]